MICTSCVAQLHGLCDNPGELNGERCCCCWVGELNEGAFQGIAGTSSGSVGESNSRHKESSTLKDVLSTGRHRAAIAKPFADGAICEWAGLKHAGGGVKPIVGCNGNQLFKERGKYARHHGPDKNVLNNEPANLHLICPTCHNRWHVLNDPYYGDGTGASRPDAGTTWLPNIEWKEHDPITKATLEDIIANETYWLTPQEERQ